jgi:hypothetical protein
MATVTRNGNGRHQDVILPAMVRSVDRAARAENKAARMGQRSRRAAPLRVGPSNRQVVTDDLYGESGTSGLKQYGGFVLEEWLQKLRGRYGAWAYREMMDNSPIAAGIIFAIKMLARQVEWTIEDDVEMSGLPCGFIESCQHDMSHTWGDFVSEVLSMIGYGYAPHETVLKRREGPNPLPSFAEATDEQNVSATTEDVDEPPSSKYNDGLIGWRRLPVRKQETIFRWIFTGYSGIRGVEQIDWHGGKHKIPIEKMLLFRTETTGNNPEGRSLLRSAWTSYFALQNIQAIEAIGIERDLAGYPVLTPPEGVDLNAPGNEEIYEVAKELVTGIRRDEDEGAVLPSAGWVLELMSSGGSRQIDTNEIIRRYEQRMTVSLLADFLILGQDGMGSFAMVDIKSELFGVAVDVILDMVCEVFNRYAIPRLLALNNLKPEKQPRLWHSSAGRMDLRTVGEFLTNLSLAGAPIPWTEPLMEHLFRGGALPKPEFDVKPIVPPMPNEAAHDTQWRPSWGSENTPAKLPPSGKEHERVAKAQGPEAKTLPEGTALHVAPVLAQRAQTLSTQLEREIVGALTQLGSEAARSYAAARGEGDTPRQVERLVGKVMAQAGVSSWVRDRLTPLLRNHAQRVAGEVSRVLAQQTGRAVSIGPAEIARIQASAGSHLKIRDIEPQVREAVHRVIVDGLRTGESPVVTAERIREAVPEGRFVHAGVAWRAQLIGRDQTSRMMREGSLAAYAAMPDVKHVESVEGVHGAPSTDPVCVGRSGEVVALATARLEARSAHPLCSLGFNPIVGGPAPAHAEPQLLAA